MSTSAFTETIPCFNVTSEEFATEEEVENKDAKKSAASSISGSILGAAGIAVAAVFAFLV